MMVNESILTDSAMGSLMKASSLVLHFPSCPCCTTEQKEKFCLLNNHRPLPAALSPSNLRSREGTLAHSPHGMAAAPVNAASTARFGQKGLAFRTTYFTSVYETLLAGKLPLAEE